MPSLFKKIPAIYDVVANNVSQAEEDALLILFERTMQTTQYSLAREARFDTSDFAQSHANGVDGFALILSRQTIHEVIIWEGRFSRGNQALKVMGILE